MGEIVRIVVTGRVQGVGYRFFAEAAAHRLGIPGWVRNLPGGQVEIVARLDPRQQAGFLVELRRGPPAARVEDLTVQPVPPGTPCPASGFTTRF